MTPPRFDLITINESSTQSNVGYLILNFSIELYGGRDLQASLRGRILQKNLDCFEVLHHACFLKPFMMALTSPININTILAPANSHLISVHIVASHANPAGVAG